MRNESVQPMPRKDIRKLFMRACTCGQPWAAVDTLYRLLMWLHVKADYPRDMAKVHAHNERCRAWLDVIIPDNGAQYILFYLLTALDLEEHGGSTPGWLTRDGEALLLGLGREAADDFDGLLAMSCVHGADIDAECSECDDGGRTVSIGQA